ncbi:DMT family transporter [Acinetobacter rudis]|uniref:EamA domain-containing protein n=1 Tax=Acinetobacter rudis CIP 110305 TaxID=421052 RepID=S3N1K4_9GAMM|nr:DMT family transporter [Acinetobacter rudis]EPF73607.1 hypothetical protein F945_02044 [Acinetobacter rudis CIP 110305]
MLRQLNRYLDFTIYLKLICVALLWGGTFIAGRMIASEIPAPIAALIRFLIASLLLLGLMFCYEGSIAKLNLYQLAITAVMGLTGVTLYNLSFFAALAQMPASRTALFVSLTPVLTLIAARIFFKEKLSYFNYCGAMLALLGTFIVITQGHLFTQIDQSFGQGEWMMLTAIFSWVIYTLFAKLVHTNSALTTITYSTIWGTFFLFIYTLIQFKSIPQLNFGLNIWLALFYLGSLATVLAFIWYAQGIEKIGAARTIIFNYLVPLFALILSYFILDEQISTSMYMGGALSFIGILMTNKKRAPN